MKKIKILIVDDHAVVRMGLASLFSAKPDFDVVGQAKNSEIAVRDAKRLTPDVIIMDLMMPGKDGIETTRAIQASIPNTKILILTSCTASDSISNALDAGAQGAIMKSAENTELIAAIRKIASGAKYISPEIKTLMENDPPVTGLTGRQTEILQSLTRGLTNKDIAKQLGLSIRSVEDHVDRILERIGAANRAEAVAIALRKHLLKI